LTGPERYHAYLFPGEYDITYYPPSDPALPDAAIVLARGRVIDSGAALNLDIRPLSLSGKFTLNGGAVPDSPNAPRRGSFGLAPPGQGPIFEYLAEVAATGAATFDLTTSAGAYDYYFRTAADPLEGLPSNVIVLLGRGCAER
jgi:hypothetical protein